MRGANTLMTLVNTPLRPDEATRRLKSDSVKIKLKVTLIVLKVTNVRHRNALSYFRG